MEKTVPGSKIREVFIVEVFALVGPSGTGKSHRAVIVAHSYEADIIIDDGLLIQGNRIVGGRSAKQQPTRIGAIKAALFMHSGQVEETRKALAEVVPKRVLVLGTSSSMVERICLQLDLPFPVQEIRIDDVASEKEIRKAKYMRNHYAKHVIPAPTVEVKRSFPDTIIDPLVVFLKRKGQDGTKKDWMEQSVVRPTFTCYGRLSISNGALVAIISKAVREVQGVVSPGRVNVIKEEDGIGIEAFPCLLYGVNMKTVCREVQEEVKKQVEDMTGLTVKTVDITVRDISLESRAGRVVPDGA